MHKLRPFYLLCAVALLAGLLPLTAAAEPPAQASIPPDLLRQIEIDGQANFFVVMALQADLSAAYSMDWNARGEYVWNALNEVARATQAPVIDYAERHGLDWTSFLTGNSVYIRGGNLTAAQGLAALPGVAYLRLEEYYQVDPIIAEAAAPDYAIDWGITDTNADDVWNNYGIEGAGIKVANIDTGVQYNHPALDQAFACPGQPGNAACWHDPANICGGTACDNNGHGTHTMGTMVGDNDASLTYWVGMAPDATWIACKGCESSSCSSSSLNSCADWILAPGGSTANRPHIVNNSWGGGGGDDWYLDKVETWVAAGIFPAFSAGNSGSSCSTIGSPGDYQESFATAAHTSNRTIASYSSRGPSDYGHDPYTKPNISAPGSAICSSVPTDGWDCTYNGTSMASPHTAGAVALLWAACPAYLGNIDATFQVLQDNADTPPAGNCGTPPDGEGNYTYGYGYLNALAAIESCIGGTGTLQGTVTDATTSLPISGAAVTAAPAAEGNGILATTDPNGFYSMLLTPGTYNVTASHSRYYPQTVNGVMVVENGTTTQDLALEPRPLPCILLVDDDNNAPDALPYFTAALDDMGLGYDVFDTAGGNGPDQAGLSGYKMVFWFSGDTWGGTAGPNSTDETNLAAYLDDGGRLFLSSQDYLYDMDLTTFGSTYLGIGSYANDTGNATAKVGLTGDPIGDGLGPFSLTYPSGFTDYGDVVTAGTGASQAFRSSSSVNLDVDKVSGVWKTVFFGTDWVPIYNNNAANGRTVLQRIVDWFGGCEACDPPSGAAFTWTPASPYVGDLVTFNGSASGTAPISYAWDWGDGGTGSGASTTHTYTAPGDYVVTMTATNACGSAAVQHTVTAAGLPDIAVSPLSLAAEQCPNSQTTQTLQICNNGTASLTWSLSENPDAPWLSEDPAAGTLPPAGCVNVDVTFDATGLAPGDYTADLIVNSNDPDEPAIPLPVALTVLQPADITSVSYTATNLQVAFDATALGEPPLTYAWDFSDGATSSLEDPTHTYAAGGCYTVSLVVSNGCGQDTWTGQVCVCDPVGGVEFAWSPPDPLIDQAVAFTATVAAGTPPFTFSWDLGDGATASGQYATHAFAAPGTYTVTLTVANACGQAVVQHQLTVVAPDIEVTAPPLEATLCPDTAQVTTLTICNAGTAPLTWSLSETPDAPWLGETPAAGTLPPAGCADVTVTFDATGLAPGDYTADLIVNSNDPDEPAIPLPVALTVLQPADI
ncbi:MAG: PKD domain-containing protein, partial [Anaerolineae bacterium]|nr:PKD domain-containing protein [Anaerolineae bacterium]